MKRILQHIVKYTLMAIVMLADAKPLSAQHKTIAPDLNGMEVVVNNDWMAPPVVVLGSSDVLHVSFDQLSHEYRQYTYHLEHCEADWSLSEELFQVEWLEGFNERPVEEYAYSVNTTVNYTHYELSIPNDMTRIKMSGNYLLSIVDEEGETAAEVRFMVVEPLATLGLSMTTNTDIGMNREHQQLSMELNMGSLNVSKPDRQLYVLVTQNQLWRQAVVCPLPDRTNGNQFEWVHCPELIFKGGNEWHKFEVLDVSHTTMGLDAIKWNGISYDAYPTPVETSRNYLTDVDADGAFIVRNSDFREVETTCDYVRVHYELRTPRIWNADVMVGGRWATGSNPQQYLMDYDETAGCYRATIWQKQGYYNYQFFLLHADGTTELAPSEGCYYQTGNRYQAYVYYKGTEERTWRLVAFRELIF